MQRFHSKSLNKPKPNKDSPPNVLENNQNTTLKTPHMKNQIIYQKISTSSQKRSPNQLLQSEIPEAFQPTEKAFCKHIKLLWGLIYQNSVPMSPDYTMLKESNTCFSFLSYITTQSENSNTLPLVPLEEILTLRNTPPGKKEIGNTIIHMTDFSIKYIFASLAGLGVCCWASDLNEASNTLYNKACGLKNIWYTFAVANGFPNRYQIILADPEAHSKDEFDPISNKYMIKNLEYRSEKATIFMHRVDEEIVKAESTSRKKSQRRERHIAEDGRASIRKVTPNSLPIDFYDPDWFNNRTSGQKISIADIHTCQNHF
ncbi:hypothetical protein O181_062409 [Austropuccinia psidii MF-1]|uniref:Uncharacterized protein n=1 Tax=Austropuccinia psidii MF-1 TaxID=1389203 RepID=A0A9Q3EKB2_9BASI|nr:hypothetical protein [Austropuccinia psidii MF-1]